MWLFEWLFDLLNIFGPSRDSNGGLDDSDNYRDPNR